MDADIEGYPLAHYSHLYASGNGKATAQSKIASMVVTSVVPRNTQTRQTGTIDMIVSSDPNAVLKLEEQIALLMSGKQDVLSTAQPRPQQQMPQFQQQTTVPGPNVQQQTSQPQFQQQTTQPQLQLQAAVPGPNVQQTPQFQQQTTVPGINVQPGQHSPPQDQGATMQPIVQQQPPQQQPPAIVQQQQDLQQFLNTANATTVPVQQVPQLAPQPVLQGQTQLNVQPPPTVNTVLQ